ncbi:MAG: SUMF1/EgtB/PvdO family nonheme iron enzyme [Phycisphaeraceae bacterium]|nr:SUMF1/EgtB/PvdO family nonheme iron enzyme [Phycisphaeraceae bacterium]
MKQASEDADRKQESVPVTAIEAIAAVDRLAITGEPGGGKSTLVNYLFVRLAQARLQAVSLNDLEGWRGQKPLLPVRIILRKFAKWIPDATTQGQAGLVWDYIEAMIEEKKGRASVHDVLHYVRKTLETEGGIMFFDGLDEVGYGQEVHKRDVIKQAIMDISGQLKKAKIILTSRPYAYRSTDSWRLPKHTFAIVNLALFNKDQIHTFARRWYLKVGKTVKGWDDARCDQMTGYFYHAVDTRDRLFEIVRNPLLLTMAVALHSRDNFLPHKRAELYEKVIELLLAHWENNIVRDVEQLDVEQGSDAVPHLKLDMNKLLYSLSRIAFECHTHQLVAWTDDSETVDISRGDLLVALGQDFGQEMAGLIIEYIQFRTGILQGKDNQTYAFMHRTFQEYLAACYILEQERFNELILERMEHDLDWWQEVFLLMAGAAKTRRASTIRDLVEPLLGGKQTVHDFSDERDFKTLWLAAQTLWETNYRDECVSGHKETAALYQRTFKQVYDCLKQGMTATGQWKSEDRATAGKWLSRLGDDRRGVTDSGHMAFCPIAKGEFWLGDGKDDDCPQELCQALDYDYQLAKFPVTVAQYRQFAEAGGYQTAKYWPEAKEAGHWQEPGEVKFRRDDEWRKGMPELSSRFAYDNHPMVEVSWYECLAYCRWLTDLFRTREVGNQEIAGLIQQGWLLMLPSEIEWEKAARGSTPSKLLYPCGDEITSNCANYSETGLNSTSSVGCFPGDKSPCKCIDMTGNVIEWCRNTDESYPYLRDDREKVNKNPGSGRVIRGGCWGGSAGSCRCSFRFWDDPDYGRLILGFRVALVPSSVG